MADVVSWTSKRMSHAAYAHGPPNSHTYLQNKAAAYDGKIPSGGTKIVAYHIVLSPYPLNNCRCEGVRSQHEKGEAGQDSSDGSFDCGIAKEEKDSIKVGEGDKIVKKHVSIGVFTPPGAVLKSWTEAGDEDGKGDVLILCHGTVVTGGIIELGASL